MSVPVNRLMPASLPTYAGSAFHYTSSAGLLGSLKARSVWASAASSLNDLNEVRQGWVLVRRILESMPGSEVVDLLQDFAKDPLRGEHEVFILSASTDGDDANQWRLYADGGRGYAIELDASVPLAAVSDVPGRPGSPGKASPWSLAKDMAAVTPWRWVLYDDAKVETALNELVDAVERESQTIATSGMPEEGADLAYDGLQTDAYEVLSTIAHLIKDPGFAGEHEVRVVATFVLGGDHINYRPGSEGIVGYARFAEATGGPRQTVLRPAAGATRFTSLPVKSVRLGPRLRPEHAKTLQAFLRAEKLRHVEIKTSAVPLR